MVAGRREFGLLTPTPDWCYFFMRLLRMSVRHAFACLRFACAALPFVVVCGCMVAGWCVWLVCVGSGRVSCGVWVCGWLGCVCGRVGMVSNEKGKGGFICPFPGIFCAFPALCFVLMKV